MDLIPNRWYAVLDASEVPSGTPVGFERMGRRLVFWRDGQGQVRCADDRCPHRGAAMSSGFVRDGQLQCRYHGFCFDSGGQCTAIPPHPKMRIPQRMALSVHTVRQAHDLIWFWNGAAEDAPDEIPFFDFSGLTYAGSRMQKMWPTHYARVAENELDWAHLPFVHRNTIGRGLPEAVEVEVEIEGDRFRAWSKLSGPDSYVELLAPNVWRLRFSEKMYNFLAFAPVNDASVVIYGRTYQGVMPAWPLNWLFGKTWALTNPFVLRQDFVTVTSQRPKIPSLSNGDVFVPSDKAIVAFFRWRRRLQQAAQETPDRMASK
ncbi:MAG: Rieske 2Fe-2S domain-containing protein [Myxococcota bacterium]